MLIPYGTDAPIYHRPFATISIIAINVAMFWLTGMGEVYGSLQSEHRWLILEFNRINPLQWVTAAFMHASWAHLVGNMIFLWCFGLVVEGKLGWKKFGCLYLVLCLAKGAITQIPMFVFCWAPENDMQCLFTWFFPFVRFIDVSIFALGLLYFALQLLPLLIGGFHMSTPMLHLLGMLVGFPVAIYMLKHNMVDCEGWDVISRWNDLPKNPLALAGASFGNRENRANAKVLAAAYDRRPGQEALQQILADPAAYNPRQGTVAALPQAASQQSAWAAFQNSLASEKPTAAKAAFRNIREQWGTQTITEALLAKYVALLGKHGKHIDSLEPLSVFVSRGGAYRNRACLRIARIQLQLQNNYTAAQATIQTMSRPWSNEIDVKRRQIVKALKEKINT